MTVEIVRPRPVARPTPARRRPSRPSWIPYVLVAGWAAQICLRLWLARERLSPAAEPDESGYLIAARWLAGGPGADMTGHTFYQGGYPLLLAPAYWVSHDPGVVYALVIVINSLVGAVLFPLGYVALRRLDLAPRTAMASAWAAALLPAATLFGGFALADAVMPAVVLGWLLALDHFVRHGSALSAAGSSLAACYAYAVHSRGAVLLVVHIAVLGFLIWRRHCGVLTASIATAAGLAAVRFLNGVLRSELYPGGSLDLAANVKMRTTTLDGQAWALSGAAGQVWYLAVSTWGLAGVGLAAILVALLRRRTSASTRLMAAALLATTLGVAYASSAALPDEHRVGNFAYGRYLSCVALVYTLIGLAALARLPLRKAVVLGLGAVAVVAASGLWVRLYAGERLDTHTFVRFDFPETSFLTFDRAAFHLGLASLSALALLAVFIVGARVAAVGLLAVNVAAMLFILGPNPNGVRPESPLPGASAGGVAVDHALSWRARVKLLYPVWWTRIDRMDIHRETPPPSVCTVVVSRPKGMPPEGTWPGHPNGWRPYEGQTWPFSWVAWRNPACGS